MDRRLSIIPEVDAVTRSLEIQQQLNLAVHELRLASRNRNLEALRRDVVRLRYVENDNSYGASNGQEGLAQIEADGHTYAAAV